MSVLEKNIMRQNSSSPRHPRDKEFEEVVIEVARVSRVAKGGRRIRFRALVVIGNKKGKVGYGIGKANEVSGAVAKAVNFAKKRIVEVPIINGTIPHDVLMKFGGASVMLKPASAGTSIVAGGSVRSTVELAGITDILTKIRGSRSKINNVVATIKALSSFNKNVVSQQNNYATADKRSNIQSEKTEDKSTPATKTKQKDIINKIEPKNEDIK